MQYKILIIEDNYDVRENLGEILTLSGYDIILTSNGKEGVKAALNNTPDLILCDIMMPELDGFGVLRILSRNPKTDNIPFIFLTAKTEMTDLRKGMTLGSDDYITKPFDDVELLDIIEMRLRKKSQSLEGISLLSTLSKLTEENVFQMMTQKFQNTEYRTIRKKDLLYAEGQKCRNVFLVVSGKAISSKMDNFSKEVITRLYKYPMLIGITAALTDQRYHETIRVLEDMEVLPVRAEDFLQLIYSDKSIDQFFLKQFATEKLVIEEKLLMHAYGTVRMKLATTLVDLYFVYEENGEALISISRDDLASMAGTAKETVIRCLGEFKDENLIHTNGSDIIINNVKNLLAVFVPTGS